MTTHRVRSHTVSRRSFLAAVPATAAGVQLCAAMSNFDMLEHQWGEVPWRGDLLEPPERFELGRISVPNAPGFGVELNQAVAREHA